MAWSPCWSRTCSVTLATAHPVQVLPSFLAESLFFASDFQREAESDSKKKGKFKTMKVLKLLGNKRDAKSKAPAGKS